MSLISFYLNETPDDSGRLLSEILAFSHDDLEYHHDFIQWIFPLEIRSPVNPNAPILDDQLIQQFRTTPQLQKNMLKALDVMLDFYGLKRDATAITRTPEFTTRAGNWLSRGNHNHLRLTRILHSLALCGLENEAAMLLAALLEIAKDFPRSVTPVTLDFWQKAIPQSPGR